MKSFLRHCVATLCAVCVLSAVSYSAPQAGVTNIALNKPAQQSSTSPWSKPNDAQGAVDGIKSGSFGFHTNSEKDPWWQVDLQSVSTLKEIRVFNRIDAEAARAETIQILLSTDGRDFKKVFPASALATAVGGLLGAAITGKTPPPAQPGPTLTKFGGADGKPLVVDLKNAKARYVRLQLNTTNYFHLDEVEIYGTPGAPAPQIAVAQNLAASPSTGRSTGLWNWKCCGGRNSGMFLIDSERPDGAISGAYLELNPNDSGTIQGRIQGDQIQFTRRGAVNGKAFEQTWTGRLQITGGTRRIVGTLVDRAAPQQVLDFSASEDNDATVSLNTGGVAQIPALPAGVDVFTITGVTRQPSDTPRTTDGQPAITRTNPSAAPAPAPTPRTDSVNTPRTAPPPASTSTPAAPPAAPAFSSLSFEWQLVDANNNKTLEGSERFNLRISIKNSGGAAANNVQVRLAGEPAIVSATGSQKAAGNILPGQTQVVDFSGVMPAQIEPRNAEVTVSLLEGTVPLPQSQVLRVGLAPADVRQTTTVLSEVIDVDYPPPAVSIPERTSSVAVVVGISNYRESGIPKLPFATHDAEIFGRYLENIAGVRKENIKYLADDRAARSDIEDAVEDWLPLHVTNTSQVYFYYAGHGALDPATGETYLVPYEGSPDSPSARMYSLKRLYDKLGSLKAQNVTVFLDSCFSGGGRSIAMKGRPIVINSETPQSAGTANVVVLAAAAGNQVSSDYEKNRHGLFTYFLLKGMKGEADTTRDGWIDLGELSSYVRDKVRSTAASELNREQTPVLTGPELDSKRTARLFKFQK